MAQVRVSRESIVSEKPEEGFYFVRGICFSDNAEKSIGLKTIPLLSREVIHATSAKKPCTGQPPNGFILSS